MDLRSTLDLHSALPETPEDPPETPRAFQGPPGDPKGFSRIPMNSETTLGYSVDSERLPKDTTGF